MKSVIRLSALFVAVAGLASAAFYPAATHAQPKHASMIATSPVAAAYPGPLPCGFNGCVDSTPGR